MWTVRSLRPETRDRAGEGVSSTRRSRLDHAGTRRVALITHGCVGRRAFARPRASFGTSFAHGHAPPPEAARWLGLAESEVGTAYSKQVHLI
jgi:hypothetical protein